MRAEASSTRPPLPPLRPLRPLRIVWLGRLRYAEAWALQERLRRAILDEGAAETLLLLEHEPVITLGRSADPRHVLASPSRLAALGVDLVKTSRGGDVTFHGPGQLVAYPVVRVDRGVVAHVEAMARAVIDVAGALGIRSTFHRERPGVWVGARKLCAFGVHIHRRISIHGLALNVTTAASEAFSLIVPCGLADAGVVSIAELAGGAPSLPELAAELGHALARELGRAGQALPSEAIVPLLSRSPSVE